MLENLFQKIFPKYISTHNIDVLEDEKIIVYAKSNRKSAICPCCGETSKNIHSKYVRTLTDLKFSKFPVTINLEVHKFFCHNLECEKNIFVEDTKDFCEVKSRSTKRYDEMVLPLAMNQSSNSLSKILRKEGYKCSCVGTLINRIRHSQSEKLEVSDAIGIDDWASKKRT